MAQRNAVNPALRPRPLSPHLQIWRWTVTMASSILHRVTGVGLAMGTLLLAWWLVAVSAGPDAYDTFQTLAGHWFGRFVLFGFTLSLVYHLLNGVRHLFWDMGLGFDVKTATRTGQFVFAMSIILTLAVWVLAYAAMGAFA
jgi:succinate dehydrogenase / fumarate reductase cytochrome b subunit